MRVGGPWLPNNCQNLDSDLFDIIYDTGTQFKCYKTSLHLQDLENQTTAPQNVYISNFLGKHALIPPYSFQKKICPPNFSKLAMALILFMTHALNMKFKCVVSLYAYFLKLKIPAASEKIIRLLFHCLLCSTAAIFYELSWQICFDFSR